MQEDRRVHADANALRYNRLPAVRAGNPLDIDHAIADDDAGACACTSSSNRTSFMLFSSSRGEGVQEQAVSPFCVWEATVRKSSTTQQFSLAKYVFI